MTIARPEIVFFDIGYTLIHPAPSFAEIFCSVLGKNGIVASCVEVEKVEVDAWKLANTPPVFFTLCDESSRDFWFKYYAAIMELLGLHCSDGVCGRIFEVFSDPSVYRLYPDVLQALEELRRRGFRLGVISNWEGWLRNHLRTLNVDSFFDPIVISGAEGLEKPDPAIFRMALEKASLSPHQALHVGDSISCDFRPSTELGMSCVLIDRRSRLTLQRQNLSDSCALPFVRNLEELLALEMLK